MYIHTHSYYCHYCIYIYIYTFADAVYIYIYIERERDYVSICMYIYIYMYIHTYLHLYICVSEPGYLKRAGVHTWFEKSRGGSQSLLLDCRIRVRMKGIVFHRHRYNTNRIGRGTLHTKNTVNRRKHQYRDASSVSACSGMPA